MGSVRLLAFLCLVAVIGGVLADAGEVGDQHLPLTDTVIQYGITWKLERPVRVGQFVSGDYYVVGPVTVVAVSPEPDEGRNGSVLNLPINGKAGFDDRIEGDRYDATQAVEPPIRMKPGDSLISTVSVEKVRVLPRLLRHSDKASSPVKTAAVLTCLAEPAPVDAFRPSYCDTSNKIYLARNLRRDLLPGLPRAKNTPKVSEWERIFERPWLDTVFDGYAMPVENGPAYGRECARAAGNATLLLCCDLPEKQKEQLLIKVVQVGIDLWGIVRAGHRGWPAHGGHGSGRKWLIVFAGIMLGDEDMQSPANKHPKVRFGEDMQTMYGKCWTGADVVYAGHVGKEGLKGRPDWGAYEHLPPSEWPGTLGESYRRCCTSVAWVGEALAIRMLHAEKTWSHDAFLDYVDRWMTEDDTEHIRAIHEANKGDYSASYLRQGQAWDRFVGEMWAKYRHHLPPAPAQ